MIDFVICIGNGDETADDAAKKIAIDHDVCHRGFLDNNTDLQPGCYHTSIYDIKLLQLTTKVADIIDRLKIIMLDQDESVYKNSRDYHDSIEMAQSFESKCAVEFVDPSMTNLLIRSLRENKSFCISPFIALFNNTAHCCYMKSFERPYTNFDTDPGSVTMREQMLAGEKIDLCQTCYNHEEFGANSPRIGNTENWIYKLNLKSYEDVVKNTKLIRYEIALSNYCNLQCRMCCPEWSNQIDTEYYRIGLSSKKLGIVARNNLLDSVDIDTVQQLHVTGGEPSINQDFYDFLKRCIKVNKTDFEISMNTNGVSLTKEFLELIQQFKNVKISISIDGFDRVNQYIRWPTNWEKFKKNVDTLAQCISAHNYHFNTTLSIYNISQLYEISKFLDQHHSTARFNINPLENPPKLQAWNFPNKTLVLANLEKIKTLDKYRNDVTFNREINGITKRIQSTQPDLAQLKDFFNFNDRLDQSRKVKLADYIPELEQCRSWLIDRNG